MTGIGEARSLLFVPGTRADRFDRALASGADAVILDLEDAVSIGFGGKLAIHPRQVAAINRAWTPAPALMSWAERVIAAVASPTGALRDDQSGEPTEVTVGVTTVDGQMVDLPVITRARRILARATLTANPTTANGTT